LEPTYTRAVFDDSNVTFLTILHDNLQSGIRFSNVHYRTPQANPPGTLFRVIYNFEIHSFFDILRVDSLIAVSTLVRKMILLGGHR